METKGHAVYLIDIPSNTLCAINVDFDSDVEGGGVCCRGRQPLHLGGRLAQTGRGAMCTLVLYAAATDAGERSVVRDPPAREERGERQRRCRLLA
jgi:hypothetical protein